MRSFLYRLNLRNLDIIYVTIYPASIYRVLFKYNALEKFFLAL